jgi:hypothetical protein
MSQYSNAADCSLSLLVSRPDVPYMMQTVPHIVRSLRFKFADRFLIVDTAPLHKRYVGSPNIATLEQLRHSCRTLTDKGVVDRWIEIDYSRAGRDSLCNEHYGQRLPNTHDFRGCPLLALPTAIRRCTSRYLLHFDPDILLHHAAGFDWVSWGIETLRTCPEVMFVCPRPGPPDPSGHLKQGTTGYERDSRGFFRFLAFSQRKFLVDTERLKQLLLPLTPIYISTARRWLARLRGESALWTWEFMMDQRFKASGLIRADLDSPSAWTLHAPDHGREFVEKLPVLIMRIEKGEFPEQQSGDYDLRLEAW